MKKKKKAAPNEWRIREVDNSDRCWWWLASLFMAAILAVIVVSCTEEPVQPGAEEEGLPATIRLEVMPDAATQAQTRVDENAINNLHVLLYNSSGELVAKNYTTGSTVTLKTRSGSGYKIYAIANTGNSTLFDGAVASTETKLQTMNTADLSSWDGLTTASHLVMVGSKTGVAISAGSSTLSGGISVVRLAAKVTLKIGVKSGSGITITNYQVFSLPRQSRYVPGTTDGATSWINGASTTVNATSVNKTFFMYENRKGIVSSITAQKDKGVGKAPANAAYVVINGETFDYKVSWRIYLGENNTSDFNMKRNSQYTYSITLNCPGTDGVDTRVEMEEIYPVTVGAKSNCYMVKPGNAVTIPVARANESFIAIGGSTTQLQSSTTWTASLVWESSKGLVTLTETTGTGPSGRFKVTATNASAQGNAVVAIKNGSNQILWSWHIWVTTYDGSTRFTNNNGYRIFTFMDRALGATSATAGQLSACGLLYQWGRKDPFPCIGQMGGSWSITEDSDPIRVYNAAGNQYAISKTVVPNVTPNNLTNATRNPDTFYYYADAPYDWFVYNGSSAQNHDLWGGSNIALTTAAAKSVFDPCPVGWRVPPWLNNTSPFEKMDSGGSWSSGNHGMTWPGTGGYFPASGYRFHHSGGFYIVSVEGPCWMGSPQINSTQSVHGGYFFNISSGGADPGIGSFRANGFSVRCSKD